jgi:hypothetical protein
MNPTTPNNIPPNAVVMEGYLLGCLIRDEKYLDSDLMVSDFYEPKHQDIASVLLSLKEREYKVDMTTVVDELMRVRSPVDHYFISQLFTQVGESFINQAWIDAIKRTSKVRKLQIVADKLQKHSSDQFADPEQLLAYFEGSLKQFDKVKKDGPQLMDLQSLEEFDRNNDPNAVLGRRWLCRGGSLLMVGQSGTGKSSLMMQAAISWAIGRNFFGITTKKSLKTLIVQAENDRGDVGESYQDCVSGARLTMSEKEKLKENLFIYRDTISSGDSFLRMMRELIVQHQADIVFVDPLLSFAGIDISEQEQASQFLRHGISPILLETGAILVAMHHTGKPKSAKDKEGQTISDMAYAGLGSSEFTNYFREVAVLARVAGDEPEYKFGLTKRRGRAYLTDENGKFKGEISIRHSREDGVIRWEYAKDPTTPIALTGPQDTYLSNAKAPKTAQNFG